jgi:VWFA-related protein
MLRVNTILIAFLVLCGNVGGIHGQGQTAAGQQPDQKLTVSVAEVAVDVVVRDKQGRPVKGLTAADFEVSEEGVLQQITSSRMVTVEPQPASSGTATGASASAGAMGTREAPRVTAVAFVFDRLTPEVRVRARDAALSYIGENLKLDSLAAVYVTGLSLEVLQPLTRDAQLVKAAIERAGGEASATYKSDAATIRGLRDQLSVVISTPTPAQAAPENPQGRTLLESQLRLLESFEALQQEQMGLATINGLHAAIDSMQGIPGRKAVIFFSEGMALPQSVEPILRSVIGSASSSHVSVYAIDAAGLRIESAQAAVSKDIQSRSTARMAQIAANAESTTGPMTKELERNETVLRSDPRAGLGALANQTGGFLIADTNDLNAGIKKIDEDIRTYYMLTYSPKDQTVDGRFRRIEVKVKRSGLSVQSRRGYYAVNGAFSSPVMEFETPALAIAASGRRPDDLKVRSSAISFPESARPGFVTLLAEFPMQGIVLQGDENTKKFSGDFSVVVLVKSESRQVVTKVSHRYSPTGPLTDLEAARKGDVLFYRELDLDPGRYQVQTVVYDALGKKAGARENQLEVPAFGEKDVRVSNIVLIKRAERLNAAEQTGFSPFRVGQMLVYPNMGEPVQKTTYKQLPFLLTVYVPKGTSTPSLVIELAQKGTLLGQLPAELPAADDAGRIQYSGALPLQSFPPGEYELRMTVKSGTASVTRAARFTVE